MPITKPQIHIYEQMGRATLLPGMRYMLERMQAELDEFEQKLNALQNPPKPRRGRPPNAVAKEEAPPTVRELRSSGWPTDPEERKREMARRMAKRDKKKTLHPRDPQHPKHAEFLAAIRKGVKKRWAKMTPAKRKATVKKMVSASVASRAAANPQLAVAS